MTFAWPLRIPLAVLMTSLTAFLGLMPLAYGVGASADMLRPMAIAVIGSLFMSLLLSLIATPVFYYLMVRTLGLDTSSRTRAKSQLVSDESFHEIS